MRASACCQLLLPALPGIYASIPPSRSLVTLWGVLGAQVTLTMGQDPARRTNCRTVGGAQRKEQGLCSGTCGNANPVTGAARTWSTASKARKVTADHGCAPAQILPSLKCISLWLQTGLGLTAAREENRDESQSAFLRSEGHHALWYFRD